MSDSESTTDEKNPDTSDSAGEDSDIESETETSSVPVKTDVSALNIGEQLIGMTSRKDQLTVLSNKQVLLHNYIFDPTKPDNVKIVARQMYKKNKTDYDMLHFQLERLEKHSRIPLINHYSHKKIREMDTKLDMMSSFETPREFLTQLFASSNLKIKEQGHSILDVFPQSLQFIRLGKNRMRIFSNRSELTFRDKQNLRHFLNPFHNGAKINNVIAHQPNIYFIILHLLQSKNNCIFESL